MTIKKLTNDEILQLLNSYEDSLREVLNQSDNGEDSNLLNHIMANIHFIKNALQIQSSSDKFSWQIMTSMTGVPHVLRSISTDALQYDTEQNISKNFEQLYNSLLLNNTVATENLQKHIDTNEYGKFIVSLLILASLILSALIAPWSAWGVSFLLPLYPILAVPLVIILFASIVTELLLNSHSRTLSKMHLQHEQLDRYENQIPDQDGFFGHHKTSRFFQPGNHENGMLMLDRVKESFDERFVAFEI